MKPKKIKDLMSQGNLDDKIVTIIDRLMLFRHQPYSEILKMPIPLIEKIMKRIDKQIEREKKAIKK
ncbi:MAG: hypothetical protein ACTSP9_06535 [Promethearchaeota archaeon]